MRKTVRLFSEIGPEERLGQAIAALPPSARQALTAVADREDLPLIAGTWARGDSGCLVANVVRDLSLRDLGAAADEDLTLDLRILRLLPEMSSRDLNRLIVAWDEAADQEGRSSDAALRRLLHGGLARAGERSGAGPHLPVEPGARVRVAAPG
ncbi:hypothetical protein BH20ACT7_BH20ACT7_08280 [soil metagenome]